MRQPSKDDSDIKLIRRRMDLPTLQRNVVNIFNGHTIYWKYGIPAQISLFYHSEVDTYEIVSFDLLQNIEMERLYANATTIHDIIENMSDVAQYQDRKVALYDIIKNMRLTCSIDFIMGSLSCQKAALMPAVPTLRKYNEILYKVEPLSIPKPVWLVPAQVDDSVRRLSSLFASGCKRQAVEMSGCRLKWMWAIKKVIVLNRVKKAAVYAWKRATQSSQLLRKMQRDRELALSLQKAEGISSNEKSNS